jgi:hypothetical protein
MYILFAIIWFAGVLIWDVASDVRKWKNNIPINHTKEMITRCLLLTPSALALWLNNFSIVALPIVLAMQGAWWWELFDGFYNKMRGFKWRFNGSKDPDDSRLDSFLYHMSATKQTLLKWGLIALSTTLYIIL